MNEAIGLRVQVPPPLAQRLGDGRWRAALAAALCEEIGGLAAALGVPGEVAVDLVPAQAVRPSAIRALRVWVNETLCRFTLEQVLRVFSLARGEVLAATTAAQIADWLQAEDGVRFVAWLAREAVSRDPSVLLGSAQVERVAAAWKFAPARRAWLGAVLRDVLALGMSIDGLTERTEFGDPTLAPAEAAEALIAAARPTAVEIRVAPAELRRLTLSGDGEGERFALLRDGLFYECGLRFPDLRFVEDQELAAQRFAFRINAVPGLPWVGLAEGEVLVNDSAGNVAAAYRVPARPAVNPNNGTPFAVAKSLPPHQALTAWTPLEYVVLCLSVELRRLAPRLLDRTVLAHELGRLAAAFPALGRCARARYTDVQLVRVLRALADEGMPIRDLRRLLTALVDFDTIAVDPSTHLVLDDRLPVTERVGDGPPNELLVAAVRSAHKRYLTHKYGGGGSLSVLLLDPELEREIRARAAAGALLDDVAWCDRVLDAIAAAAPAWGATARPSCLLTTLDTRAALRRLVAQEAPHLPVLCYQDLAPEANIAVLARVALTGAPAARATRV